MSIYGDFLSDLKISETKRWKADLKNKTLICEGKKYIELTRNPQKALQFVFSILDGEE